LSYTQGNTAITYRIQDYSHAANTHFQNRSHSSQEQYHVFKLFTFPSQFHVN